MQRGKKYKLPMMIPKFESIAGRLKHNGHYAVKKALTEGREVLKIRLQSHQVHPTALTILQELCSMKQKHIKYTEINTNK